MKFFYTTDHPHRWSTGPEIRTFNKRKPNYPEIESLAEAKELAEYYAFDSYGDDRCMTTYGVMYDSEDPLP